MTTKERVMTIRLMDRIEQNPAYARKIGVSARFEKYAPKKSFAFFREGGVFNDTNS